MKTPTNHLIQHLPTNTMKQKGEQKAWFNFLLGLVLRGAKNSKNVLKFKTALDQGSHFAARKEPKVCWNSKRLFVRTRTSRREEPQKCAEIQSGSLLGFALRSAKNSKCYLELNHAEQKEKKEDEEDETLLLEQLESVVAAARIVC